jgi:hypothetical protein
MSSRQPNILLIFVDNQPASMMGDKPEYLTVG